jgi:hypothetical protein
MKIASAGCLHCQIVTIINHYHYEVRFTSLRVEQRSEAKVSGVEWSERYSFSPSSNVYDAAIASMLPLELNANEAIDVAYGFNLQNRTQIKIK